MVDHPALPRGTRSALRHSAAAHSGVSHDEILAAGRTSPHGATEPTLPNENLGLPTGATRSAPYPGLLRQKSKSLKLRCF